MTYFFTAIDPETGEIFAQEIEALNFEEACAIGRELARDRFGGRRPQLTGVTESPRENLAGARHVFCAGTRNGELFRKERAA